MVLTATNLLVIRFLVTLLRRNLAAGLAEIKGERIIESGCSVFHSVAAVSEIN